jgi:LETM1-like protein
MTGSKMLWTDFKTMRALKLKHEENPSKLTGRERRVLRQTPLDIQLAFPLVAFSLLPIAGYLAPLIGLQFSK